ncbi:PAS domain S-box protein [Mucilaginibacter boryungensis]|uniref:histidine kinase n=1 Tax=Mucilaginibacter boryungensis TaxID=768480 RepID=A0ABR9XH52_9SPHI|nr:PAS domain S-box protein [Mucilaginibacter boryungensis]MBE9666334.1 PAS domain S-box protein [Mucilaginibacter boryungensis]
MGVLLKTDQMNHGDVRFRKLIEHSYAGVTLLDRDLNVIYRSPSAERITGWKGTDRAEVALAALVHPQDEHILQEVLLRVYAQPGEPLSARFRTRHYAGHYIWVECILTNLLYEPEVEAIVFNFVDITRQVDLETEQQQSQDIIRDNAAFIRLVTDHVPAMIAYFSADLRCRFANKPYEEHFGAGGSVIGKLKTELLLPGENSAHERHIKAVLKGKRQSFERSLPGPEGTTLFTHTQYLPDGKPGNVKGFYSLVYDITEIKAAEIEIRQKSKQMEELLDSITDGFIAADANQCYTYVNKRLCEMVGLTPEEMIGRNMWELFPDAVGSITYESIQQALRENRYIVSEDYYAPLDLWQENRIYPRADGFSMFIRDITSRKKADEQLRLLFDRAPDLIGIVGIDRYFKRVNAAMCRQLGYTEQELLATPLDLLVHPDDLEVSRERTKAFIVGGDQTMYFENRFLTKNGKAIWLSWTVTRSAEEGIMFCVGKNISDKKEMENLLQKVNQLARIGGWEVDRVNGTAYWSPITREIYDVPEDFVPNSDNWLPFYREGADRDYIAGKMAGTIATGQPCDAEVQLVTAKGHTRWVRAIAEAEFRAGVCVRVYGSFQDIDDRKKAELAATAALAERNNILDSIGDGFFAVDRNWIVTYWNATAEQTMGTPREMMLGKYFWDIYSDAVDLEFYQYYQQAMFTGKPVHFEDYYPPMQTWFGVHAYPSENGLSVFFRDITEAKKSAQALAESERRYSNLFQLSPQPMFVYDMETLKYLDVNAAAITHYGYSREEFLSMTIVDIRPEDDIPLLKQTVAEQQEQEKVQLHGIFRHRKKTGEIIQVDIQSNQISYKGVRAKVVLANDVTERVRYIEAIEAQNKKLMDISWMQSHIIRAPLSRIMGLIPMLTPYTGDDPEQRLIQEYLVASANELDQVIRSIIEKTGIIDLKK